MDILQIRQQLATHHQDSFAWALRCCAGNRQEAEDLLQSSYLKILEQKARYRQQQAQFKTWLFTIIRNTAVDFYRKKSPHAIQLNEALNGNIESFIDAETGLQTDETQAIFKEMLTQLSPQQQQVLQMHTLTKNNKINEVAAIKQLEKILVLERQIKKQQLTLMIRIKNKLTDKQKTMLKKMASLHHQRR